jgi:hypothetical protein
MGAAVLARIAMAIGLTLACGANCRAATPARDLPEQFSVVPVAQHVRVNGLPADIEAISTFADPQRACAWIAEHWEKLGYASLNGCRRRGEWLLVTRCVGLQEQTVQLRGSRKGTFGYLSRLDLRARPTRPPWPRIPLPAGARVLSVMQSSAPGGEVVQFTVALPMPPAMALRRLGLDAGRLGWAISDAPDPGSTGGMFELRRNSEELRGVVTGLAQGSGLVLVERVGAPRQP